MWRSMKDLVGYQAETRDGARGKVKDFYFDDRTWTLRYAVLDTGSWLAGRVVLISPESFEHPDWGNKRFPLNLTKEQIDKSPVVDPADPLSLHHETALSRFYGWTPYWSFPPFIGAGIEAASVTPILSEPPAAPPSPAQKAADEEASHLHGLHETLGYRIAAADGDIGKISDFIVNDDDWAVHLVAVDTRVWMPGLHHVVLAPQWFKEFRWADKHARVELTRDQVRRSPPFDPAEPVNEAYEGRLYDYYGRPRPERTAETPGVRSR